MIGAAALALVLFTGLLAGFNWLNNHNGDGTPTAAVDTVQPTQGLPVILPTETLTLARDAVSTPTITPLPLSAFHPPRRLTPTTLAQRDRAAVSVHTPTPWPTNTVAPYP